MTIAEKQVIREKITATSSEELIEKLVNMVNEFPYTDSVNMHICAIISNVPYEEAADSGFEPQTGQTTLS